MSPRPAKQKSPAYQWYPKDYESDERVKLMTWAEQGIYRYLLDCAWLEGSIPANVARIARLVRLSEAEMAEAWIAIAPCFEPSAQDPSRLVNRRLERSRQEQEAFRAERSDTGRRGAEKRWTIAESHETIAQAPSDVGLGNEQPIANVSSASASASAPAIEKRGEPPLSPSGEEPALPNELDSPEFKEAWGEWVEFRRSQRWKKYQPLSVKRAWRFLAKQPDPIAVIDQSIRNNYMGLFEIEEKNKTRNGQHKSLADKDAELAREIEQLRRPIAPGIARAG